MSTLPRPCLGCGALISSGSRCPDCAPKRTKPSATQRGYPAWWQRLSRQARAQQPWCTQCLRTAEETQLTLDHSTNAWNKVQQGKRLTIKDVIAGELQVLCVECNSKAGSARGQNINHDTVC